MSLSSVLGRPETPSFSMAIDNMLIKQNSLFYHHNILRVFNFTPKHFDSRLVCKAPKADVILSAPP